ncbi:type VI secretion system-associated protein TagF [Bosea sp. BK604]|uniref:type VI secretion system-associated protein TagF n=1 Tax=Bosea sp. BK604 TaxID=2512180 RepID=UPI0010D0CDCA|nr:type VI secretion system-associated protein TagF [Bosea sp. BK604]TCR64165.1 type VI secretion system protein ImpM [Bosea sp. BK604]
MTTRPAVGLFGKLPWEGDFIQRGLPSRFVRPWDEWLSQAMAASREALGPRWSDAYLLSPPWRFVIEPGILGPSGWAGILASSVDRVRRFFPLTLALELPAGLAAVEGAVSLGPLCAILEEAALSLIDADQSLDLALEQTALRAEAALIVMRPPLPFSDGASAAGASALLAATGDDAPLQALAGAATGDAESGWWHDRWSGHAPAAIRCEGLPDPAGFAAFLDGDWPRHGWSTTMIEAGR